MAHFASKKRVAGLIEAFCEVLYRLTVALDCLQQSRSRPV